MWKMMQNYLINYCNKLCNNLWVNNIKIINFNYIKRKYYFAIYTQAMEYVNEQMLESLYNKHIEI